jgi:hypothetical protein
MTNANLNVHESRLRIFLHAKSARVRYLRPKDTYTDKISCYRRYLFFFFTDLLVKINLIVYSDLICS